MAMQQNRGPTSARPSWNRVCRLIKRVVDAVGPALLIAGIFAFAIWLAVARYRDLDGAEERSDSATVVRCVMSPKQPGPSLVLRYGGEDQIVNYVNIDPSVFGNGVPREGATVAIRYRMGRSGGVQIDSVEAAN